MKRFERIASVVTKQSRAQKPRTRLVRRLTLILALTFFIFPVLTLAQKVPPVGQPPIQRQPPPPLPDLVPWAGEVSPNFCAFSAGDLSPRGGRSGEFSNIDLFVFVKNQWGENMEVATRRRPWPGWSSKYTAVLMKSIGKPTLNQLLHSSNRNATNMLPSYLGYQKGSFPLLIQNQGRIESNSSSRSTLGIR
jgi:hypothetical protein